MSNTEKDDEFYSLANQYIDLANEQCEQTDKGKVSAMLLYAAARFNTYIVASSAADADQFDSLKESAFEFLMDEYKKMLNEHFADYKANFEKYLNTGASTKTIN